MDSDPAVIPRLCDLGRGSLLCRDLGTAEGPWWGCGWTLPAGERLNREVPWDGGCSHGLLAAPSLPPAPAPCAPGQGPPGDLRRGGGDGPSAPAATRPGSPSLSPPQGWGRGLCLLWGWARRASEKGSPGSWPSPRGGGPRAASAPHIVTYCDTFVPFQPGRRRLRRTRVMSGFGVMGHFCFHHAFCFPSSIS